MNSVDTWICSLLGWLMANAHMFIPTECNFMCVCLCTFNFLLLQTLHRVEVFKFFLSLPAFKIACQSELWHGVLHPKVIGNYKTQLQRVHCFECGHEEECFCTIFINIGSDSFIFFGWHFCLYLHNCKTKADTENSQWSYCIRLTITSHVYEAWVVFYFQLYKVHLFNVEGDSKTNNANFFFQLHWTQWGQMRESTIKNYDWSAEIVWFAWFNWPESTVTQCEHKVVSRVFLMVPKDALLTDSSCCDALG